jgi:predicted RNase H-like nuclease (RuvC/YqgF family)
MPTEEKRKIQAWIPVSLWINIDQMGFTSQTEAVTHAFKKLLEDQKRSDSDQNESNIDQKRSNEIKELSQLLEENEKRIHELQARLEEKENITAELREHNNTLKEELEIAHQDKDNIQNLYDNYMRQIQTLIQQKAIEAPGEKKSFLAKLKFW